METIDDVLTFLNIDKASYELQQELSVFPDFKDWVFHRFKTEELIELDYVEAIEIPVVETSAVYSPFQKTIWQIICESTIKTPSRLTPLRWAAREDI